jgi:hypothetical protein
MTDPQPNKAHFDTTNPRLDQNLSQVSTNHVRVHAAHNCEHDCYNSFTLCGGCTHSPWVTIILGSQIHVVRMEYPFILPRCALENHNKAFQWIPLACNISIEVSLTNHNKAVPTLSHGSAITTSLNIPAVSYRSFPAQPVGTPRLESTIYYVKPYPYRLIVVLFLWVVAPWIGS